MKQPLMFIPPVQAEILSDHYWPENAGDYSNVEARFAPSRWLDDELPEETLPASHAPPGEAFQLRAQSRKQAA